MLTSDSEINGHTIEKVAMFKGRTIRKLMGGWAKYKKNIRARQN